MVNRFFRASSDYARRKASQSAAWAVFARDTVSGFITTAHHTLMLLGVVAIGALGIMFVKPDIADQLKALSPFAAAGSAAPSAEPLHFAGLTEAPKQQAATHAPAAVLSDAAAANEADAKMVGNSRQQQWVTDWLSKRYRVAADATNMLVSAAYLTAREIKLDPLLILSVMAIESGFNPFAESPVGAQGLMQVMSKVHRDKFEDHGGVKAALNPVANIRVGSLILKDYVTRGGSIEAGLKLYVGAGAFDSDSGYGSKVLAEYRRLKEVAMGKKVPVYSTSASSAPQQKPRKAEASGESAASDDEGDSAAAGKQVAAL
jgi:soluble lytic murein transglycosylase-like protein